MGIREGELKTKREEETSTVQGVNPAYTNTERIKTEITIKTEEYATKTHYLLPARRNQIKIFKADV